MKTNVCCRIQKPRWWRWGWKCDSGRWTEPNPCRRRWNSQPRSEGPQRAAWKIKTFIMNSVYKCTNMQQEYEQKCTERLLNLSKLDIKFAFIYFIYLFPQNPAFIDVFFLSPRSDCSYVSLRVRGQTREKVACVAFFESNKSLREHAATLSTC